MSSLNGTILKVGQSMKSVSLLDFVVALPHAWQTPRTMTLYVRWIEYRGTVEDDPLGQGDPCE